MLEPRRAHSLRILGSAVYDGLILMGIVMIAGAIALPFNQLITGDAANGAHPLFQLYIVAVICGYFLYFWKRSGQTVGMKAWRIKLINLSDQPFTWAQLGLRLLVALPAFTLLCIGVFWQYLDKQQLNWQDRASGTKLVHLPKK